MQKIIVCALLAGLIAACGKKKTLFVERSASHTGIDFSNNIKEDEIFNVINYEYMYNGGGVGIGDFNNDGLEDVYFTGNFVSNKLYLNKGNLKFEDITTVAKVSGDGKWSKGVSVVDINADGLLDLYICCGVLNDFEKRKNILYINKGIDKTTGKPIFADEAASYGLDDGASSHMANFFDYDKDGDLDVYIVENDFDGTYSNQYRPIVRDGSKNNTDKLYRNDFDSAAGHAVFTDVSKAAGITIEGYGLGIHITDFNNDTWPDIYVSNDYLSNNLLYINNKNGTFSEQCNNHFKHTSKNAMGNDVADLNNDGRDELIELDMAPGDNYRSKMMMNDISYQTYQNNAMYGYMMQYARNMLHANMGPIPYDTGGKNAYSEIANSAGIAQTDWSWAPLLTDVDNDGLRDIIITNGLPKDMSDLDFINYRNNAAPNTPAKDVLAQLPAIKVANYGFKNIGNFQFENKTKDWGLHKPTFSAGMAYADLDNDGDMDLVVNNSNMQAQVLENTQKENNWIAIELKGDAKNKFGIGTTIEIYCKGEQQIAHQTPYRGYLSSVSSTIHFGLGKHEIVDKIIVRWPNEKITEITKQAANKKIIIDEKTGVLFNSPDMIVNTLFIDNTAESGIAHRAYEDDFIDFDIQRMIPHKLSQQGPALAVADLNGDGLEDIVVGGSRPFYAKMFLANTNGQYTKKNAVDSTTMKYTDDAGICLFDADGDGDNDMYIASGGSEQKDGAKQYADHLYLNDGKGKFSEALNAVPEILHSKSCVKGADYDGDGDIDLFVGGRCVPGMFPKAGTSSLLRNDTKNGVVVFTNITNEQAPQLANIGMVTDACFTDVDSDGSTDLIVVGQFMAPSIFLNKNNKLTLTKTSLSNEVGWYNSIAGCDMDNDGDMDYVLGNFGNNSFLQANSKEMLVALGGDFDNNQSYNVVLGTYYPAESQGKKKLFPVCSRDEYIKEMSMYREKFPNYASFAKATYSDLFTKDELKNSISVSSNQLNSYWAENEGNLNFKIHLLPTIAQWSPIHGILTNDINNDGYSDLTIVGNEYWMNPYIGRIDAGNGLILLGNNKKELNPLPLQTTGFYVPSNAKALVHNTKDQIIASQNLSFVKSFKQKKTNTKKIVPVNANDKYAILTLQNNSKKKIELYYGSSYYSQTSRQLIVTDQVKNISIVNSKNEERIIQ